VGRGAPAVHCPILMRPPPKLPSSAAKAFTQPRLSIGLVCRVSFSLHSLGWHREKDVNGLITHRKVQRHGLEVESSEEAGYCSSQEAALDLLGAPWMGGWPHYAGP
jgi:hypothetical protein